MTHITTSGKFATAELAIASVTLPKIDRVGDRFAIIVATKISARRTNYGVQFWTYEMIQEKAQTNSDGTVSVRVA